MLEYVMSYEHSLETILEFLAFQFFLPMSYCHHINGNSNICTKQ
jgi:hypothetical protein